MKQLITVLYILIATTLFPQLSFSQTRTLSNDSLRQQNDSITTDSISVKEKLETTVFYTAKDSMVFTKGNMGYLYGDADVKYGDLAIKGEYITMNLDSNIVSSTFGLDSVGILFSLKAVRNTK